MMELAKVREITANVLKVNEEEITENSRFIEDLGADSLDLTSIIMELEDEFGIEIPDEVVMTIKTVGDAADRLKEVSGH